MRAVVQRVLRSRVESEGREISRIGKGLLVFLGIGKDDDSADIIYLADKIVGLRVFEDDEGKMNLSVVEVGGEVLLVSQFTLYGNCHKGRRPSFSEAASPELAHSLYEQLSCRIEEKGIKCGRGRFQARMKIEILNDGPVTLILDSKKIL